jgi:hypothetical protein
VEIVTTAPASTMGSEHSSNTLRRLNAYLRNSMGQEGLNALAVLITYKDVTADTLRFMQEVIKLFASQKNQRWCFLYKYS